MKVFKLFYQLIRANLAAVIIGLVLLLSITIPINTQFRNNLSNQFELRKSQITVFNEDTNHPLSQHLYQYLSDVTEIIPVDNQPEAIADALFSQKTSYILTIPQGFSDSLLKNATSGDLDKQTVIPLEKYVVDAQDNEAYVDVLINTYLQNVRILTSLVTDVDNSNQIMRLTQQLDEVLSHKVEILPTQTSQTSDLMAFGAYYTHYASYVLTNTFIMTFGFVILSMRQQEIVKRDRMSNLTLSRRTIEILLGCISFSILYWFILMIAAYFIYGGATLFSPNGLLIILSSFISMLGIQAMSYFFVTLAPNKGIISFLATFISLFIAFGSGLFAPREFVANSMQLIASIATPIWQVKADEIIMNVNTLTSANKQEIAKLFGIQLLLTAAYYAMSFTIQKYRQYTNSELI